MTKRILDAISSQVIANGIEIIKQKNKENQTCIQLTKPVCHLNRIGRGQKKKKNKKEDQFGN